VSVVGGLFLKFRGPLYSFGTGGAMHLKFRTQMTNGDIISQHLANIKVTSPFIVF